MVAKRVARSCVSGNCARYCPMPDREQPDENQEVADALARATGQPLPKGEDLLGDPELQRQLREAKEREARRHGKN